MTILYYLIWFLLLSTAMIKLLMARREPVATLAWLFFIVLVPYLGPILFLIFGPQRLERKAIKRKQEIEKVVLNLGYRSQTDKEYDIEVADYAEKEVLLLAQQISDYPFTEGNAVEIFPDPYRALQSMQDSISLAKKFIHLEYYIIESDEVTENLFDHLVAAADRGVEVRILYDSFGSLFLKRIYFTRLSKHGIKTAGFLPFSFIRLNFNFRNHRKLLLIDGEVAFTGGTNLSRKYLGKISDIQLHDYTAKIQGPVINQLQDVFAKDWHFTTQEDLFDPSYYPAPGKPGHSTVQVLESGPDSTFQTLHRAVLLAISIAKKNIYLTTPYFIPDHSLISALTLAALRGIQVKLLLPHKNDHFLVHHASRSFYDELMECGVEIYEFMPRVLHAKLLTIDNQWAMIGSGNMDIRSFRLNFELNLLIYGEEMAAQTTQLFFQDLAQSIKIEPSDYSKRPLPRKLLENACRMLSPIL